MADEVVEPLSDNEALNQMVDELEELTDLLGGRYDKVAGDGAFVLLTSPAIRLRAAMPTAVRTVVTNKGPSQVEVRENGVVCALVAVNASVQLPGNGAGPLKLSAGANSTANIAIATYTRNVA